MTTTRRSTVPSKPSGSLAVVLDLGSLRFGDTVLVEAGSARAWVTLTSGAFVDRAEGKSLIGVSLHTSQGRNFHGHPSGIAVDRYVVVGKHFHYALSGSRSTPLIGAAITAIKVNGQLYTTRMEVPR
jgi:hypothetical protein